MALPHQAATATLLADGRVLVVGSFADLHTGAELYDPHANSWTPSGPMVLPRGLATATLLPSGRVLIAGGIASDTGHSTTRTELYDPRTNSWTAAGGMAVPRSSHTATLLRNGQVLVAGGQNAAGYIDTAELYDPGTDHWTAAARMEAGYAFSTSTLLNSGKVLIAGGVTFGDGRAELYDPATNRWSNAGVTGRLAQTATPLGDGKVLITGAGKNADLYDPATSRWSPAADMLQDRVNPSATLLADGRVLLVGGTTTADGQQLWLSSGEIYDPSSNRWSAAGCMEEARWEHTATLLGSRDILVAGGDVPSASLSSTELFDPSGLPATAQVTDCHTSPATAAAPSPSEPAISQAVTPSPAASVAAPTVSDQAGNARPVAQRVPGSVLMIGGPIFLIVIAGSAGLYAWARRRRALRNGR